MLTRFKIEYAFFMMQPLALGLTKLSFIYFYRRIFLNGTSETAFNLATIIAIGIVASWMISFFFAYMFICGSHPSVYWESIKASSAHCFKTRVALNGFAISDFLTDAIVLLLPIPMVSFKSLQRWLIIDIWYQVLRLQMTTSRKIAVLAVFGLGAV